MLEYKTFTFKGQVNEFRWTYHEKMNKEINRDSIILINLIKTHTHKGGKIDIDMSRKKKDQIYPMIWIK